MTIAWNRLILSGYILLAVGIALLAVGAVR